MSGLVRLLAFVALLCCGATAGKAQPSDLLPRPFDATLLTPDEKRFLQTALAFEGHYSGLLDGEWGGLSQRAINGYATREFNAPPAWIVAGFVSLSLLQKMDEEGWSVDYLDFLGMSFLLPSKALNLLPASKYFVNFEHTNSSLSYAVGATDGTKVQDFHEFTVGQHGRAEGLYTVREQRRWITRAVRRDGEILYTRSDFVNGRWSTVLLSADPADAGALQAVAASISVGRGQSIGVPRGSTLDRVIQQTITFLQSREGAGQAGQQAPRAPDGPEPGASGTSSGSGFFVSFAGDVLTNQHVVEGCSRIKVNGRPARRIGWSQAWDLALLKLTDSTRTPAAAFAPAPARLNSDVTVVGYPLSGLLGGLNVTRGSISSVAGLRGDENSMQISAPVQSGNSGGPVLSNSGAVVGVVVSKLNVLRIAGEIGDIPQNVNFAIRGEVAKLFLSRNGVAPQINPSTAVLAPEVLAEQASKFTVFVECFR